MSHAKEFIQGYVPAKYSSKPHALARVFTADVQRTMHMLAQEIAFPATTCGLSKVADVVCGNLNRQYENIYTFCFTEPPVSAGALVACGWMVVMSEKAGRAVRIGADRYDWRFNSEKNRVSALAVTVAKMGHLSAETLPGVIDGWKA